MQNKPQKPIKPLIRSASLILNIPTETSNVGNILMLQRKSHMTFANSLVFPGGVCDQEDQHVLQNNCFEVYSKVTAVRETYQETGILLLPPGKKGQVLLKEIKTKVFDVKQINHNFFGTLWKDDLHLIHPIIRMLTVHNLKMKRFDCLFYMVSQQVIKINLNNPQETSLLNLSINQDESMKYHWLNAQDYLGMFMRNQIILIFPQVLILNCLKEIEKKCNGQRFSQIAKGIENIQPFLLLIDQNDMKMKLFSDQLYDEEKIMKEEPPSQSKETLRKYFQKYRRSGINHLKRRLILDYDSQQVLLETNQVETTILKFLNKVSKIQAKL